MNKQFSNSLPNYITEFQDNLNFVRISYKERFFKKSKHVNIPKSMIVDFLYKPLFINNSLFIRLKSSKDGFKTMSFKTHWSFKDFHQDLKNFMISVYTKYNPDCVLKKDYKKALKKWK